MKPQVYGSWGRTCPAGYRVHALHHRHLSLPTGSDSLLSYGNGRSYGDSCLNPDGWLLHTRGLDRFLGFDQNTGLLRCEAGVLLSDILDLVVPRGWFLPVVPGTRLITVGGAIANDVHGKNHHRAGSFGCHVVRFELLRSDGMQLQCSADKNPALFSATIGGLGLTGLILWAEIQLQPVLNACIEVETHRFDTLENFFSLSAESDKKFEYTAAWVDCAPGNHIRGRGILTRGNHAPLQNNGCSSPARDLAMPLTPPFSLVNPVSVRLFNGLYYRWPRREKSRVHYIPFLFPLDHVQDWNRAYGTHGFFQYQCVIPHLHGHSAMREILERIAHSAEGSFLAVLKIFGERSSPGLLSFPRPGITLAVDFPNRGSRTLALLSSLDTIVSGCGGAVYPAKDARMSGHSFRQYFPNWKAFSQHIDPRFTSGFWQRVME